MSPDQSSSVLCEDTVVHCVVSRRPTKAALFCVKTQLHTVRSHVGWPNTFQNGFKALERLSHKVLQRFSASFLKGFPAGLPGVSAGVSRGFRWVSRGFPVFCKEGGM